MALVPVALQAIFGKNDIVKIIQDFDWKSVDVKDNTREGFLTVKLAPSFGTLNQESIKSLSDEQKIAIVAATKAIGKLKSEDRTWEPVVSALTQSALLEPAGDSIHKVDKLIKEGFNVFKFEGAPDQTIVDEVRAWFANLIGDEDILRATPIDIEQLANIVAQTGATVEDLVSVLAKHEHHEKSVIDVDVMRYPDISHPYITVYRIQLHAWSDCERTLMFQNDKNGILGEFTRRDYQPRKEIIDGLREEVKAKVLIEAEGLFGA